MDKISFLSYYFISVVFFTFRSFDSGECTSTSTPPDRRMKILLLVLLVCISAVSNAATHPYNTAADGSTLYHQQGGDMVWATNSRPAHDWYEFLTGENQFGKGSRAISAMLALGIITFALIGGVIYLWVRAHPKIHQFPSRGISHHPFDARHRRAA